MYYSGAIVGNNEQEVENFNSECLIIQMLHNLQSVLKISLK